MDHLETAANTEALFEGQEFERNHVGGRWTFPRAPFELEVFSPVTSAVLAAVPFSSRLDVGDAVDAAVDARTAWSDRDTRRAVLARFVERLTATSFELVERQAAELGLHHADSSALVAGALSMIERLTVEPDDHRTSGVVAGHILGWGCPVVEMAVSVLPSLFSGRTVVVKPSIRAPLTVAAIVAVLVESDLPAGAVNLVHGQGTDVGSALVAHAGVDLIVIRGSASTVAAVAGSCDRRGCAVRGSTGVEQHLIVPARTSDDELDSLLDAVTAGVRANTAGGPLGLHHLHCHRSVAEEVEDGLRARMSTLTPTPLIDDVTRRASRAVTDSWMTDPSTRVIAGSLAVPDDRVHRMGWYLPPAVIEQPAVPSSTAGVSGPHPVGPILTFSVHDDGPIVAAPSTGSTGGSGAMHGDVGAMHGDLGAMHGVVGDDLMDRVADGELAPGWFDRGLDR